MEQEIVESPSTKLADTLRNILFSKENLAVVSAAIAEYVEKTKNLTREDLNAELHRFMIKCCAP